MTVEGRAKRYEVFFAESIIVQLMKFILQSSYKMTVEVEEKPYSYDKKERVYVVISPLFRAKKVSIDR